MTRSDNQLNYLPGLDGVRALAAFLVILAHWPSYLLSLKFGWMGVNIFFVLSGFLITRILLLAKDSPFKTYLSRFYRKRVLRIFPLYYGYLLLTVGAILLLTTFNKSLLNDSTWADARFAVKHNFAYYLTYTYNIEIDLSYFTHITDTSGSFFGHLWSLSVEEQFYIVFPLIVYFSSAKTLKTVIVSVIVFCPILRLWGVLYGVTLVKDPFYLGDVFYSNTLCQADALCAGAALAVFNIKISKPYRTFFIVLGLWLLAGITCFFFLRKSGYFLVPGKSLGYDFPAFWFSEPTHYWFINIRPVYQYALVNLFAVAMILPAINGKTLFPKIFQSKPVRYFGQISYGVYVFHFPIAAIFVLTADKYFGGWYKFTAQPLSEISCFIAYLAVVVCVAHLSYKYFERSIMTRYRLKVKQSVQLAENNCNTP